MGWHFICVECARDAAIKTIGFWQCAPTCECCGQPITVSTAYPVQGEHLHEHMARCARRVACRCTCPGCYVNSAPGHCRDTTRGCLADAHRDPR